MTHSLSCFDCPLFTNVGLNIPNEDTAELCCPSFSSELLGKVELEIPFVRPFGINEFM